MASKKYQRGLSPCNLCNRGSHSRCNKREYCSCNCPNVFKPIQHNNYNTTKNTCCRNHALIPENVYMTKDGHRICIKCVKIRRANNKEAIKIQAKKCYEKHKLEYSLLRRIQGKFYAQKIKRQVLTYYGKDKLVCVCCGENTYEFLTIDHINNDGNEKRKNVRRTGHNIYRYLVKEKFPQGYQTLCFNCNSGKAINKGTCPHKLINTIPVILNEITMTRLDNKSKEGDLSRLS